MPTIADKFWEAVQLTVTILGWEYAAVALFAYILAVQLLILTILTCLTNHPLLRHMFSCSVHFTGAVVIFAAVVVFNTHLGSVVIDKEIGETCGSFGAWLLRLLPPNRPALGRTLSTEE